jgi:hypothetical protein
MHKAVLYVHTGRNLGREVITRGKLYENKKLGPLLGLGFLKVNNFVTGWIGHK